MTAPHDRPTATELIEAVREWLERDVVPTAAGRVQFHARVAVNVLAIVERELATGDSLAERHRVRLAQLGAVDDADLAARIRSGEFDDRLDEVRALVWDSVRDKLSVAKPTHLG